MRVQVGRPEDALSEGSTGGTTAGSGVRVCIAVVVVACLVDCISPLNEHTILYGWHSIVYCIWGNIYRIRMYN